MRDVERWHLTHRQHAAIVSNLPLYWHRDPQTRIIYRLIHAGVVASLHLINCVSVRATALDVVNCTVTWNFHLCARLRAAFWKPLLSGTCTQSLLLPLLFWVLLLVARVSLLRLSSVNNCWTVHELALYPWSRRSMMPTYYVSSTLHNLSGCVP